MTAWPGDTTLRLVEGRALADGLARDGGVPAGRSVLALRGARRHVAARRPGYGRIHRSERSWR